MAADKNIETKIVAAAKLLFIENGFAETSMSDIAARAGINRPALHYYFRTKDKMFQAVFGDIVNSFVPKVLEIVTCKDFSIEEKIVSVVDIYYALFTENPHLPLFMVREMNRDVELLVKTVAEMRLTEYIIEVKKYLLGEMAAGRVKQIPLRHLFFTFYALLSTPFMTQNLVSKFFLDSNEDFSELLAAWKPCIIFQLKNLLLPDDSHL